MPLIDRQVAGTALEAPAGFDCSGVVAGECCTVAHRDLVMREVTDLLSYFDIVLIHHDHNERSKAEAIRERVPGDAHRIAPLAPVRETEARMLADREVLREPAPTRDAAGKVPRDVQKIADPRALLKTALGGRRDAEHDFARLGQTVALEPLSLVPAYRRWTSELRQAMERLRFL